ncbi:MAG: ribonuclease H family protein [Bacteroidota bacterium]
MAKKKKYYVVWEGHQTGIFGSWTACQLQIKGYPNAKYKAFPSKEEAEAAYHGQFDHYIGAQKKAPKAQLDEASRAEIIWKSISVDAACSGNPGLMEYRGVDTQTGYEFFRMGPFQRGTNNIGEFLALVHALALLKREGKDELPIYSDSKIAMGWVARKTVKTNLRRGSDNEALFQLMNRGIKWLKNNTYRNPILKWETKKWGEIPADFGRK